MYYVMRNSTYHVNDVRRKSMQSEYCYNTKNNACGCDQDGVDLRIYPQLQYLQYNTKLPFYFPLREKNMVFVACGHVVGKTLFYELVSPYDVYSWLAIVAVLLIAVPLIFIIMEIIQQGKELNSFKIPGVAEIVYKFTIFMFASFESLLEKGFPEYSKRLSEHVRWAAGSFLLMGIILSNGYKGQNITSIISPILPTPFTTFNQLVENDFKIYSKPLMAFGFDVDDDEALKKYGTCLTCFTRAGSHCFESDITATVKDFNVTKSFTLVSELLNMLWRPINGETDANIRKKCPQIENSKAKYLMNHSMFLPPSINITATFENSNKNQKFALFLSEESAIHLKGDYNFDYELGTNKGSISFQREVVASSDTGFSFIGWIPNNVLIRMKASISYGVLKHRNSCWKKIYAERGLQEDFPVVRIFQPSNLQGSIKVVFVVFPFGFAIAICLFLIETGGMQIMAVVNWCNIRFTNIGSVFWYVILCFFSKIIRYIRKHCMLE